MGTVGVQATPKIRTNLASPDCLICIERLVVRRHAPELLANQQRTNPSRYRRAPQSSRDQAAVISIDDNLRDVID